MEKVLAIKDQEGLCWKCLKLHNKDNIHSVQIPEMGYGSLFDGCGTIIHLCDKCYQESVEGHDGIWNMDVHTEGVWEEFVHEEEMLAYINNMPIQGQQFVWNEFSYGVFAGDMSPQEWIDSVLGAQSYEEDCQPHENVSVGAQDRIATALERIADSLDEMLRSGLPVRE